MQAKQVLHKVLGRTCSAMHKARREALAAVVMAAIHGQRLTVTGLGRAIRSTAKEKHCIKRADRLLSNAHLQSGAVDIYRYLAGWWVGTRVRPVILVDWSDLDPFKRHFLLRASVPLQGRSLTLYEEVHTLRSKEKPTAHQAFLRTLQALLPSPCRPIIVTDAGFRTPWFKQVEALGWDWVGRVRNRDWAQVDGGWMPCKSWYVRATSTARCLGDARLTLRHALPCRLVLYRGKGKGRVQITRFGQRARSACSRRQARAGREPWLLATSLSKSGGLAKKVVKLYRLRMQLEEAFRDLKSRRFGLGLELHLAYQLKRLQILLLIATLALVVVWLMGKATELTGQHRAYQANTLKYRAVLSTLYIGLCVIDDRRVILSASDLSRAIHALQCVIVEHCL
jgi:hypothetical protein